MKRPKGGKPRRTIQSRELRRIIRVLTEGTVTEPSYLAQLQRRNRDIHLRVQGLGMGPLSLVQQARDEKRANDRSTRRRGSRDFDEIWCVFDVDEHHNLSQAINEAHQSGIGVVVSNPCFELWLVLHNQDQTAHIDRHEVQRLARDLGVVNHRKGLETAQIDALMDRYADARRRAQLLEQRHVNNGSNPNENPSSTVWRLTDKLR